MKFTVNGKEIMATSIKDETIEDIVNVESIRCICDFTKGASAGVDSFTYLNKDGIKAYGLAFNWAGLEEFGSTIFTSLKPISADYKKIYDKYCEKCDEFLTVVE